MSDRNQRLEQLRQELRLNKTEMAALMGIAPHYYYGILGESGKANLRIEHLESLLSAVNVNPMWVLTGEGQKYVGISDEINLSGDPTPELIEQLYQYVLKENSVALTTHQEIALKLACSQCFIDYPNLKTMRELAIAASVYLNLIVRYPKADFVALLGIK